MGTVVNLAAQVIFFVIELLIFLFGQRAAIRTDLRTFLASESSFLRFQLLGFSGGKGTVAQAMGNSLLLSLFPTINLRSSRMVVGKPTRRRLGDSPHQSASYHYRDIQSDQFSLHRCFSFRQ
jgi:hypothetical protein